MIITPFFSAAAKIIALLPMDLILKKTDF